MEFGEIETQNETKRVVNSAFPAVIIAGKFAAGSGVLESGTPLAYDANDLYVAYVEGGADTLGQVIGVNTKDVDTEVTGGAVGPVIRLGMVRPEALTDNTAATIKALAAEKIFAY